MQLAYAALPERFLQARAVDKGVLLAAHAAPRAYIAKQVYLGFDEPLKENRLCESVDTYGQQLVNHGFYVLRDRDLLG